MSTTQQFQDSRAERRFSASRFDAPDDDYIDDLDDSVGLEELEAELSALRAEHRQRRCRNTPAGSARIVPSVAFPTRSIEVFPARNLAGLRRNVASVRAMLKLGTDFVTVTYGAAGSRQAGTKELVGWLVDAGVATYAHLTCVGNSLAELDATIDELIELGVTGILALRGDAPTGERKLVLPHATDLIARITKRAEAAHTAIKIAVAAYPTGHPNSQSIADDVTDVVRKQHAGADFAITQNFFAAADYSRFTDLIDAAGGTLPVVPGLTPTTSVRRLDKISELSSLSAPQKLRAALAAASTPEQGRQIAVDSTLALARQLETAGAPGIQLFTMNDDITAARVISALGGQPPQQPQASLPK